MLTIKKIFKARSAAARLGLAAAALLTCEAALAAIPLHIYNGDSRPITIKISDDNHNCYEGSPPLGNSFNNVQPGQRVTIMLSRVQGHGCNGRQGEFELIFSPKYNGYSVQHFDFDNDGGLQLTQNRANVYPGTLTRNADGSYSYRTPRQREVTASTPVAGWLLVCQSICNRSTTYAIVDTRTTESRSMEETRNTIEAALTSKLEFKGIGGLEGSIRTARERMVGSELADIVSRAESNTETYNFTFDPSAMRQLNIFAVWQWVATTRFNDGHLATIRSNKFTCTPDGLAPTYLPGSAQDIRACRGS